MQKELRLLIVAVLLLLLPKMFFGQSTISGHVVEVKTNTPIPYANIWIRNSNIGTTSDENGFFTLRVDSASINKSIAVSSIGYVDTLMPISKVQPKIRLTQKVYELSEVTIHPKKTTEIILNDLSDAELNGAIMNDTTPQIIGRYFPYEQKNSKYRRIKSVIVYSRDEHRGKFNLRLYSFDTTATKPIAELVHQNIIVETRWSLFFRSKPVEVDLSKFNLVFPEEGMFVGVEWLIIPENRYEVTFINTNTKKKRSITMYVPHLCATIEKQGCVYKCKNGLWWKQQNGKTDGYKWSEHYFNPAISVILTD